MSKNFMKKKFTENLIVRSLFQAVAVIFYVMLVAGFMFNAERVIGKVQTFWGPVAFLLLFVVSAAVTGYLVLGKSLMWYLDGFKKEAVKLAFLTVGWLMVGMVLVLLGMWLA